MRDEGAGVAGRRAALLRLVVRLPEDEGHRRRDRARPARTWEGEAWNVVVANAQFTDGGLRLSPRSFPGDGVLDALVFTGPARGPHSSRGCSATATTSPIRTIKELKGGSVRGRAATAGCSWTASRWGHAGDLPDRPPIDPPEAVTAAHLDRIARAADEIEAHGLDALVLLARPPVPHGYDPIPFERPTLLVLRPGATPVLLVPGARTAARGGLARGAGWSWWGGATAPTRTRPPRASSGERPRRGGRPPLGLAPAGAPGGAARGVLHARVALMGRLRAVKDAQSSTRSAARPARRDETFRQVLELRSRAGARRTVAHDLAELLVATGTRGPTSRSSRAAPTRPRRTTNRAAGRSCPGTRS